MSDRLPPFLDLWTLSQNHVCMDGVVALDEMPRLGELIDKVDGMADFALEFGRTDRGQITLHGVVKATLSRVCQRCLEVAELPVRAEFALQVVESDLDRVEDGLDPLLLPAGKRLRSIDLLEDELLLAMPLIAMHDDPQCNRGAAQVPSRGNEATTDGQARTNPFATLAGLRDELSGSS